MNMQGFFSFLFVIFFLTVLSGSQGIENLKEDTLKKLKLPQLIEDSESISWLENEPTIFKNPLKKKK